MKLSNIFEEIHMGIFHTFQKHWTFNMTYSPYECHHNFLWSKKPCRVFDVEYGIPVIIVSRRWGHAKVSTTLDIYGHFLPGMQDQAAQMIDDLVTPITADLQQQKEPAT